MASLKASISVNQHLLILYWKIGSIILQQRNIEGWGTKAGPLRKLIRSLYGFHLQVLQNLKLKNLCSRLLHNYHGSILHIFGQSKKTDQSERSGEIKKYWVCAIFEGQKSIASAHQTLVPLLLPEDIQNISNWSTQPRLKANWEVTLRKRILRSKKIAVRLIKL